MRVINGIMVTDAMRAAGELAAEYCVSASMAGLRGLGGSKKFNYTGMKPFHKKVIQEYVEGELTSVEVFYLFMEDAKNESS